MLVLTKTPILPERIAKIAALHLEEVGGIVIGARQIQRDVLRIGPSASAWQHRESPPEVCDATVLYVEAYSTSQQIASLNT